MDRPRPRAPYDAMDEMPGFRDPDPLSEVDEPPSSFRPRRGGSQGPWLVGLLIAAALAVAVAYWAFLRPPAAPPLATPPEATAPAPEPPPAPVTLAVPPELPPIELPRLDASDELVRRVVAALSARPELARWLVGEHLIRRFVATVDNIAEGVHPRSHLPATRLEATFAVEETPEGVFVAPASFSRYDGLMALFESLDPEGSARLYHQLRPLIDQAYRDLGYPDRRFDDTLVAAIRHLQATPVPPTRPGLEPGVASYRWADPRLEGLSPVQRQLLRTGPDNVRRIKTHLGRIAAALGVPGSDP